MNFESRCPIETVCYYCSLTGSRENTLLEVRTEALERLFYLLLWNPDIQPPQSRRCAAGLREAQFTLASIGLVCGGPLMPALSGGIFAITRKWWQESGEQGLQRISRKCGTVLQRSAEINSFVLPPLWANVQVPTPRPRSDFPPPLRWPNDWVFERVLNKKTLIFHDINARYGG